MAAVVETSRLVEDLAWKKFDAASIGDYHREHPMQVVERLAQLTRCFSGAVAAIALAALQGQRGRALTDSIGKALACALAEAGPTYSKFGQALSCRPDLVGEGVAAALQELQDRIPGFDDQVARTIISEELGERGRELLDSMGDQPVAAATLGQVYKAQVDGKWVALKVQRPGVMRAVAGRNSQTLVLPLNLLRHTTLN